MIEGRPSEVVVLAAGRGKRAGGPKALIDVGGQPWWKRQAAHLAGAGLRSTWVISEAVRAGMGTPPGLRCVLADDEAPMFASVVAGLTALRDASAESRPRGVFILPVDVPVPNESTFDRIVDELKGREPACGAAPTYRGKNGHPIYVIWECVEQEILGRKHEPDQRLDFLLEGLIVQVPVADANVTANLNTADDFVRWHSAH